LQDVNHERRLVTDTTLHVKIFNPDPLTTLLKNYGGIYIDSNDVHQPWCDTAYMLKDVRATYSNGIFYVENNLVTLDEFEDPVAVPVTGTNPDFFFQRNQSSFEDVNILYHITNFHDYIASLGYDSLMLGGVTVDAHAQFGADNSVFLRNGGNPTLRFGTGGVDDGEDADVIIHEYAHGLSWSANNNDNFSDERSGLDEGIADYWATSYSRNISNFHWDQVFTWDGWNEFWSGRTATTTNNYPQSSGLIYKTGEVWNAAMSSIYGDLGGIITDKLMLEAMYFLTNTSTLPEAGWYILQADSLLFAGQHTTTICTRMQQKNIFDSNCKPTSVKTTGADIGYQVFNSLGFAEGTGPATIQFKKPFTGTYRLMNAAQQILWERKAKFVNEIQIDNSVLHSGMYYVQMMSEENNFHVVLNKF
jgi:hypothetical protein